MSLVIREFAGVTAEEKRRPASHGGRLGGLAPWTPAGIATLQRSAGNRAVGRLLQRTIKVGDDVYDDMDALKKVLAMTREGRDFTNFLTYATRDLPDYGLVDTILKEINARDEVFPRLWDLVERVQGYYDTPAPTEVPPSSTAAATSPPTDNPLKRLGWDWLFVHFLFPSAHQVEGEIRRETIDFIHLAQSGGGFSGSRMLSVYAEILDYLLAHGIGDAERLRALQSEVGEGLGDEESPSARSVLSFHYGGHHTYIRVGRSSTGRYRLEYFDRQRQTVELRGRRVVGYTAEDGGRPMWFEFELPTLEKLMELVKEAQEKAVLGSGSNQDAPRKDVLEFWAANAADFGLLGDQSEPMQHGRAVNCQWASLESVIRASLGSEGLETQLEQMRRWVTDYAKREGSEASKAAVGVS